jgi:hypothetical protein
VSSILVPLAIVAAAATVIGVTARSLPRTRRGEFAREVGIVLGAYVLYFLGRGIVEGDLDTALRNAERVVDAERALGIFVEEDVQRTIVDHEWLVQLANVIYVWAHWPVLAAVAIWLFRSHPAQYRRMRAAFAISGAVGLVIFATFPVAPPRLDGLDFVDTVTSDSGYYRDLQPSFFSNVYAAVPSLHVGWNLLVGIFLLQFARHPLPRVLGPLTAAVMVWAVVATANHYFLDAVAGAATVLAALALASRPAGWWRDRAVALVPLRPHRGRDVGSGPA